MVWAAFMLRADLQNAATAYRDARTGNNPMKSVYSDMVAWMIAYDQPAELIESFSVAQGAHNARQANRWRWGCTHLQCSKAASTEDTYEALLHPHCVARAARDERRHGIFRLQRHSTVGFAEITIKNFFQTPSNRPGFSILPSNFGNTIPPSVVIDFSIVLC